MYNPKEDSFLIRKQIKSFCNKRSIVLDMGTGSGILAQEAAKHSKNVTACDIDIDVINQLKRRKKDYKLNYRKDFSPERASQKPVNENLDKITFIQSDLFSKINNKKFDLIIFNPPYLPTKPIEKLNINGKNPPHSKECSFLFVHKKKSDNSKDINEKDYIIKNTCADVALDGGKNGIEIIERFLKDAKPFLKKDGKILLLTSSLNKNIEKLFKRYKYQYKLLDEEKFFFEKLFIWILT